MSAPTAETTRYFNHPQVTWGDPCEFTGTPRGWVTGADCRRSLWVRKTNRWLVDHPSGHDDNVSFGDDLDAAIEWALAQVGGPGGPSDAQALRP